MRLEEQLLRRTKQEVWDTYCGFLDYSIEKFMDIQNRLMEEQIKLWSNSRIGDKFLNGRIPESIDEFRKLIPLTKYEDYADLLLSKDGENLPMKPVAWIQTTWDGVRNPIKVAPYSRSMLDTFSKNMVACLIMSTAKGKYDFDVAATDKCLYGLAPLPYATGLFPVLLKEQIGIEFLPDPVVAQAMSFSERNKLGFKMALKSNVQLFFGLGSVAHAISLNLMNSSNGGIKQALKLPPNRIYRCLKAKKISKKENRQVLPRDLFDMKGFMVAGTDNRFYKDELAEMWGIMPMEIFAGTEPTLIGTETWTRDGVYFFPRSCFFEFIKEDDYLKMLDDPDYVPETYLMNEVVGGEKYELVITVLKGGAFARYRVGDVFECIATKNDKEGIKLPRFKFVDRVLDVIDIAGFTRITEYGITKAIKHSHVQVVDWIARKEICDSNRPFLHLYVEIDEKYLIENPMGPDILKDILTVYFKNFDKDYEYLKKILGVEPLVIDIIRKGTFKKYQDKYQKSIRKINADQHDVLNLLNLK